MKWGLLFCGVLSFPVFAADPMDKFCAANLAKTQINVTVDKPQIVYRYDATTGELKEKSGKSTKGTILGLTVTRKDVSIQAKGSTLRLPDGRICIRPGFDIHIHLNPQTVYIGREFDKGTCAFREIMNHEMRHVKTNQSHAEMVAKTYEREMRKAFGNNIYYGEQSYVEKELIKTIQKGWLPHLGKEVEKAELLHQKIDTKQESIRAGMMCNREVSRTLANYELFEDE